MLDVTTSAPGKIILCGEHAVVYGKEALAFSLSTTTKCHVTEETKQSLKLTLSVPALGIDEQVDLCQIELDSDDAVNVKKPSLSKKVEEMVDKCIPLHLNDTKRLAMKLVLILYTNLAHQHCQRKKCGISFIFESDLPIGAGLGSSASFAVAATSAMLVLTGILPSNQDGWCDEDYELINDWAFQAERIIHGTPSGIDNSVSNYGHCVSFKAKKIVRLKSFSNLNIKVLVINTKKSRSTKALVAGVRERKEKFPEIYEHIMNGIEQITNRFKLCLQRLSEGENVETICEEMEMLTDLNQHLLNAIGVGHPTIDQVVALCSEYKLHAKLTGAGGGGCVFAIIPPNYPEDDLQTLQNEFKKKTCFDTWVSSLGEDGVKLLSYNGESG